MLPVDIDKFWADDALAHKDNCFYAGAPQVALGIRMSDECVFAEQGNPWGNIPRERRIALNKRYNDLSERIVGRRLLQEKFPEPDSNFPPYRKIGEVFGGEYIDNGTSVWLKPCCSTPKELETVLDRVDQLDLYDFLIPKNWVKEKNEFLSNMGNVRLSLIWSVGQLRWRHPFLASKTLYFYYMTNRSLQRGFGIRFAVSY